MQDDLLGAIDLAHSLLGLHRNGHVKRLERGSGPPPRIEGLTISAPILSREPPHSGEMHPGTVTSFSSCCPGESLSCWKTRIHHAIRNSRLDKCWSFLEAPSTTGC